ncbi:MAG: tripartite tricarboxylate transporter TctB family protein, partial [Thermodesulfobacteriota bacterium]
MKNNDQRSSLFWLVIGLSIALYSTKYGLGNFSSPGPGFMPFLSGLALVGLALVVFLQQLSKGSREKLKDLWAQKNWPTIMMVMGALVLYTIFFRFFGFLLDTFLLTAFLLRVMEPLSWKKSPGRGDRRCHWLLRYLPALARS